MYLKKVWQMDVLKQIGSLLMILKTPTILYCSTFFFFNFFYSMDD